MKVWLIMHDDGDRDFSAIWEVMEDRPTSEALERFVKHIKARDHFAGEEVKPDLMPNGEWVYGDRRSRWLLTRRQTTPRKETP